MDRLANLLRRSVSDPRSDGQLLAAFLGDRDESAFAELVRRHGPLVWGVCRRTLSGYADAEDAFQAAFLVLVRRAHRLTAAPTVGPWLFKVASWTARSQRRKIDRHLARRSPLPDTLPDPQPAPGPAFELDDLLLALPERARAVVVLCQLQGLTHREAAERLGWPEGTVASLVSRALARLRAKFADLAPLLALASVAAPAALVAATTRSAVAVQLASVTATASPAVVSLTRGVLRMFWVKKATAVSAAMVALLAAGVGIGVSVQESPHAVALEGADATAWGAQSQPLPSPSTASQMTAELRRIEEERGLLRAKLDALDRESRRLEFATQTLKSSRPEGAHFVLRLGSEANAPFTLTEFESKGVPAFSIADGRDLKPIHNFLSRVRRAAIFYPTHHMVLRLTPEAQSAKQVRDAVGVLRDTGFTRVVIEVEASLMPNGDASRTVTETIPVDDLRAYDLDGLIKFVADFRAAARTGQKYLNLKSPVPSNKPSLGLKVAIPEAGATAVGPAGTTLTLLVGGTARLTASNDRLTGVTVTPDPTHGNVFMAALDPAGVTVTATKPGKGTVRVTGASGGETLVTVTVSEK